jgi:8-oxo-dGTP pyrophosphatase MutT (NUDIX family)
MIKENYGLRRFGFPGGRVEAGETFEQAAIREAREETGLNVALTGPAGSLHWVDLGERWEARLFYASPRDDAIPSVQDPLEIEEVRWVSADALPSPLTRTATAFFGGVLES